ncbi:MAG: hypothetical protein OXG34_11575 [bacterium]|nr:hypothetical protein [bacterium]MCY3888898.1 hypothetical protein [bacterium]MCY3962282.1 hypothetical protein [bacterium]
MAIEYLDPQADPGESVTPYELSAGSGALTIGLLANGFPDSVPFMDAVGESLRRVRPDVEVRAWNKGNASMVADDQLMGEITETCGAVVAAYGH